MTEFEVIFYEKENGDCPIEEFMNSLDIKMRAKMIGLLELLEEKGTQLREPYSKMIEDGIFEIIKRAKMYRADFKERMGKS